MKILLRTLGITSLISTLFCGAAFAQATFGALQEYYVPIDSDDIAPLLDLIGGGPVSQMHSFTSIVAGRDNTTIVYDYFEDGYEPDIENPVQATSEVWGDGAASTGCAPGVTCSDGNDVINEGTRLTLSDVIGLPYTPNPAAPLFTARDRFITDKAVLVTRQAWPEPGGQYELGGAVEVPDTFQYGMNFVLPVGESMTGTSATVQNSFERVAVFILALEDATTVTVDVDSDGSPDVNLNLNQGQTQAIPGGFQTGATIDSTKPIVVDVVAGELGGTTQMRWFSLRPVNQWGSAYLNPVGVGNSSSLIFNPSPSTSINVDVERIVSGSPVIANLVVPPLETVEFQLPGTAVNEATLLSSSDFFYVTFVMSSDATSTSYDWGSSPFPISDLTDIMYVGWGPGWENPGPAVPAGGPGSPVWITSDLTTQIYVDYESDGGAFTDPLGGAYDQVFPLPRLESLRIWNTFGDYDMTGSRIYTVDGTPFAAAWGADPTQSGTGNPYLDRGMALPPYPIPAAPVPSMGVWGRSALIAGVVVLFIGLARVSWRGTTTTSLGE